MNKASQPIMPASFGNRPNLSVDPMLAAGLSANTSGPVPSVPTFAATGFGAESGTSDPYQQSFYPRYKPGERFNDVGKTNFLETPGMGEALQAIGKTMSDVATMPQPARKAAKEEKFDTDLKTKRFALVDLLASIGADPGRMRL